jgi:hypothetical protein
MVAGEDADPLPVDEDLGPVPGLADGKDRRGLGLRLRRRVVTGGVLQKVSGAVAENDKTSVPTELNVRDSTAAPSGRTCGPARCDNAQAALVECREPTRESDRCPRSCHPGLT